MMDKKISYYVTKSGEEPFKKWFFRLETKVQIILTKFITRVANGGSKKNIRSLQDGVFEIKIRYGSGYRIYFAEDRDEVILLLIGGDKGSQKSDLLKAKKYWSEYAKKK